MSSHKAISARYHHDRSDELAIRKRLDEAEQWMLRHMAQAARPISRAISCKSVSYMGAGLLILFFFVAGMLP